ncbi:hypothetical protein GCM10010449_23990 [Streptomyces rectiviolaceus]|uniref:DUF2934 domain-containing protein n=1 Tax=Streptomyces rectiviolaceus TaxID=332591 RepID=A0ABP6MDW2_9ACTN
MTTPTPTPTAHPPTGRRRRTLLTAPPPSAESVPQRPQPSQHPQQPPQPQPPHLQDPPIYRALIRNWAERGKTLPGRHDPEWVRLAAPPVRLGQFSAIRDPRGDGR